MRRISILLLLCVVFHGIWAFPAPTDFPATDVHKAMTQDSTWLNTSRALTPEDLRGRIILLDFWAFCCINCIHVIPDLKSLEDEFKEKLTIIGVHSAKFTNEKESDNIRQAIIRYGLEHPVVNDASFMIWDSFRIQAWPTFVIVNPEGKIEQTFSGEGQKTKIHQVIANLIKKYGDKINTQSLPIELESSKAPPTTLSYPGKLAYVDDYLGRPALFISDSGHHRILGVRLNGEPFLVVGKKGEPGRDNGDFKEARFNKPQGILYEKGSLFVADTENHLLRRIDLVNHKVETLAGTGVQGEIHSFQKSQALKTALNSPWDLEFYPTHDQIVMAMAGLHQLWSYDRKSKTLQIIAGSGQESIIDGEYPINALAQPSGLVAYGPKLFFLDSETSSLRVLEKGVVKTLIGTGLFNFGFKDGKQGTALLQHPIGLTYHKDGIFIADSYNHSIRKFDLHLETLQTLVGTNARGNEDGTFKDARFNEPNGIVFGDHHAFVADTNNSQIRMLDFKKEEVSTLMVEDFALRQNIVTLTKNLPNKKDDGEIDVKAGSGIKVTVALDPGWHINDLAPTYLALFDVSGAKLKFLKNYDRKEIVANQVVLPFLRASGKYRFQGTFYYCEIKAGSACLIQSHDFTLLPKNQDDSLNELTIKVTTEVKK